MTKKLRYFLILLLATSIEQLFAQEAKYEYAKEKNITELNISEAQEKVESFQTKTFETADSLSSKALSNIDSLTNKANDLISNTTDSINNLSSHLQNKIQSKIDSLQQRLFEIQGKGSEQLSNAGDKAAKLSQRIDSLQNLLVGKLPLDKINKYSNAIPSDMTNQLSKHRLPGLKRLSIPGLHNWNANKLGADNLSMPTNGELNASISEDRLTSMVNQQLGKSGTFKENDWIKTDLPDYQRYTSEVQQYSEMLKDPSKMDQTVDTQAAQLSEFQTLNNETKELAAMKALPESMLADLKRYQDAQAMKTEGKEMVVRQATDYFANHQDKLSEAQSMMTKLKKKYSYVPDSRDLSTAVKATSLKEVPLKKRIRFGLGFQLHQTDPISLDLAPNVMYRFNTLFSAGISGTYRASLGIENNKAVAFHTSTDVYGGSVLAQHMVWKGFFGHVEFQYLSSPFKDATTNSDQLSRRWNEGALLGIGKQMSLSKALRGQIIFTYDFLHDEYSPNPKAWNIKFGIQMGKFRLNDINF